LRNYFTKTLNNLFIMKKHRVLILFFNAFLIFSQAPSIQWQKTLGGNLGEAVYSIKHTSDNGFIFVGTSYSGISGDKTVTNKGGIDIWIVKTNATGSIEWQKDIGGSAYEGLLKVVVHQTTDEGYIICCDSRSNISGDKTENTIGTNQQPDFWLLKLDSSGNIVWQNTIGSNDYDYFESVIEASDGGFLVCGNTNSLISGDKTQNPFHPVPLINIILQDYWVVKVDNMGNVVWDKTIGGFGNDYATSMVNASDGGYIIAGSSDSDISGLKTQNSKGAEDYWIVKIDTQGNILWQKTIGGSSGEHLTSIINSNSGGYFICGYSNSNISGDKNENSRGEVDYWVLKLDYLGNILWQKTIGSSVSDFSNDMVKDSNDNCYVIGYNLNAPISGDKTENSRGLQDFWVVKINNSGTLAWDKTIGGSSGDFALAMDYISSDNSVIVGGGSSSSISGDKTDVNKGDGDFWVVKLEPENLTTSQNVLNDIQIYPNPTSNYFYINFGQTQEKVTVSLTNILGQKVSSKTYSQIENTIYEINGEAGIYLLTIENENGEKKTIKIIKQ
jgi:hypothetical protein